MPLGARVRRLLHLVVVITTAAVLAAPLLLGPGANAILRALGASDVHRCACGMRAGECGCPECERLERTRADEAEALRAHSVLKSSCDGDSAYRGGLGALPVAAAPLASTVPPVPFVTRAVVVVRVPDASLERARPPTPPPRPVAG